MEARELESSNKRFVLLSEDGKEIDGRVLIASGGSISGPDGGYIVAVRAEYRNRKVNVPARQEVKLV